MFLTMYLEQLSFTLCFSTSQIVSQTGLGKPTCTKSALLLNIDQKGGGSNPCSTILLQILYDSKGLFGNINLTLVEDSFPYAICIINHLLSIKVISHEGGIASSTIGKPCSAKTDEFQKKGEGGNFLKIPLFWQSKASLRIFTSV